MSDIPVGHITLPGLLGTRANPSTPITMSISQSELLRINKERAAKDAAEEAKAYAIRF